MATFTVTTAKDVLDADDGKLSLREAVRQANATTAADTIVFASALEGKTLVLAQGELTLKQDTTLDGDRDNDGTEVTLSGGGASRILHIIGDGTDVRLRDLTLARGHVPAGEDGGAILAVARSLHLDGCTVRDNVATADGGRGGGIYSAGELTLTHSTVRGNSSGGDGGGIFAAGAVTLTGSTVQGNSAPINIFPSEGPAGSGGGIRGSTVILIDSTASGNSAENGGGISGESVKLTRSIVSDDRASLGGGISANYVALTNSLVSDNRGFYGGGGISGGVVTLTNSMVTGNYGGNDGGGIRGETVALISSTVSGNSAGLGGGGIKGYYVTLTNSTVTGNSARGYVTSGGGLGGGIYGRVMTANSIVAGNVSLSGEGGDDILGLVALSNGHNIFGSDVAGAVIGDLQGVAGSLLFAGIDPDTGGGQLNASGIVPLRNSSTNPALGGGDPLTSLPTDQLGTTRPLPTGSLPDIGAAERNQTAISTTPSTNNDMLTGTDGANTILGKAGADVIKGLAGKDTLRGEAGNDLLDGGSGNDLLDGGDGIDIVRFDGSTSVLVDLVAGTAKRGSEIDTLTSIQGALGSSAVDTFKGDGSQNLFQGGGGRDTCTGGAARDLYDFDRTSDSAPGSANRDLITDFARGSDKLDLTGIDADATTAGDQAFRWVGEEPLTGPGEVGFFTSGANTVVRASTDADTAAEFQIELTGLKVLAAGDFNL